MDPLEQADYSWESADTDINQIPRGYGSECLEITEEILTRLRAGDKLCVDVQGEYGLILFMGKGRGGLMLPQRELDTIHRQILQELSTWGPVSCASGSAKMWTTCYRAHLDSLIRDGLCKWDNCHYKITETGQLSLL